jgi:phage shock protein A
MLNDEVCGHLADVLDLSGVSVGRTLELIKHRVNGAAPGQLLAAAVAVMRDQGRRIAELEAEVEELNEKNSQLEGDLADLESAWASINKKLEAMRARLTELGELTT